MNPIEFISILAAIISAVIFWGYKTLPREQWQIMAVMPKKKTRHGVWQGLNLTYYGLLTANAYAFAVVMFFILGASANIPVLPLCMLVLAILGVCMPASKIIARIVEKKSSTLTVGGAVFTGVLITPWLVHLTNLTLGPTFDFHINGTIFLAAVCVAYAFGEGLGRLACISFGCCYGKPLNQCSPWVQKLFSRFNFIFLGKTKKIAYASDLEGIPVIPVQIITAILYAGTGIAGTWLFLNGYFSAAFLISLIVTQAWRFVSEFFRADFRGSLTITPYQLMSAGAVIYALGMAVWFPAPEMIPELNTGLTAVWTPGMILLIQSIWVAGFLHTGRSMVTGATLSFHVDNGKV